MKRGCKLIARSQSVGLVWDSFRGASAKKNNQLFSKKNPAATEVELAFCLNASVRSVSNKI